MPIALEEIHESLKVYFDALYFGDAARFSRILHPRARLFSVDSGQLIEMDVDRYLQLVAGRESPASRGDRRQDDILEISVPTKTTAHARVRELFLPKVFTDELTFVRFAGEWKIIAKVWHSDPVAAA